MSKTIRAMAHDLRVYMARVPDGQIDTGLFLDRVGYRYAYIHNAWPGELNYRVPIADLWQQLFGDRADYADAMGYPERAAAIRE